MTQLAEIVNGTLPRGEVVISVRGLTSGFGEVNVIENLDLDAYSGEILGVVGASGTGKTVLLRTILGLIPKRAGTIEIFGVDVETCTAAEREAIDRRLGVMFQLGALFSSLTVLQNVQVPMREHLNLSQGLMDELARLKLDLVGLPPDAATKFPSELSGGMTKRAGLARALALDPEIVFLDEPTSGLDPIGAADFDQLIATLRDTLGLTVFMVTHDLDSLHTACDRIAVLADKRVLIEGSFAEMLRVRASLGAALFPRPPGARPGERLRAGMETRARYALIGFFTLAVIVAGLRLRLLAEAARRDRHPLDRLFRVQRHRRRPRAGRRGLFRRHQGRQRHRRSTFDPEDPNKVLVTAEVREDAPVKTDTRAEVGSNFLTGVAYIEMTGGTAAAPSIFTQTPPKIVGTQSAFSDVLAAAGSAVNKLSSIAERLDTFLADNQESVTNTTKNVEAFTGALAENAEGIKNFLASVAELSATASRLSSRLDGIIANVDEIVTAIDPQKVDGIITSTDDFMKRAADASENIQSVIAQAETIATQPERVLDRPQRRR